MNDLLQTKIFKLLFDSSQKGTNQEIESAYGCFMEQVKAVCQSENDYTKKFRILNITRIELVFIESLYWYGQGEKRPKICLS